MISRAWNGWTASENADKSPKVHDKIVFPGIAAKNLPVYKEIQRFQGPPKTTRSSSPQSRGLTLDMQLDSLLGKMWSRHVLSEKPGRCSPGLTGGPSATKH